MKDLKEERDAAVLVAWEGVEGLRNDEREWVETLARAGGLHLETRAEDVRIQSTLEVRNSPKVQVVSFKLQLLHRSDFPLLFTHSFFYVLQWVVTARLQKTM